MFFLCYNLFRGERDMKKTVEGFSPLTILEGKGQKGILNIEGNSIQNIEDIFNKDTITRNTELNNSGTTQSHTGWYVSDYIEIIQNT